MRLPRRRFVIIISLVTKDGVSEYRRRFWTQEAASAWASQWVEKAKSEGLVPAGNEVVGDPPKQVIQDFIRKEGH